VSGLTGEGLDRLVATVADILSRRAAAAGTMTRERHRQAIVRAIGALESAETEVEAGGHRADLAAEYVRAAIRALDSLVGRVGVEDLLDEIFASFCIGK
jgi:tRNA modification GTPase